MLTNKQMQTIEEHIARWVGEPENVLHELIPADLHIDLYIVAPATNRPFQTAVTCGMSDVPMTVPKGAEELRYAELMICLPPNWPIAGALVELDKTSWPLFWLKLLAQAPHEHQTFFAPGHTIPNGDPPEPLGPGTKMSCWFIREPLTVDKEFRVLKTKRKRINFHAIVPIYETEMRLKLDQNSAALEKLLVAKGVTELLDPKRQRVA
jgi:hypothetical protein